MKKLIVTITLLVLVLFGYLLYESHQRNRIRSELRLGMNLSEVEELLGVDESELISLGQAFTYPPVESEKMELAVYALELSQGEVELFFNSFTNLIEIKKLR